MKIYDIITIGGGAAGFFTAINAARLNPDLKILIIEKNRHFLQKVKVSGGGRCNVTNAIFEPEKLIENYPRGNDFLLTAFQNFNSKNTVEWFNERGIAIKKEADGRMFPASNSSQTIIDCFMNEVKKLGIETQTLKRVKTFTKENDTWNIEIENEPSLKCKKLVIATGSDQRIWHTLEELNYEIIPPVPSLFTFHCKKKELTDLQGVSFEKCNVSIPNSSFKQSGALLITHWGFSGPAILKISAFAARFLHEKNYEFQLKIDWLPEKTETEIIELWKKWTNEFPKKNVIASNPLQLPTRFWKMVCDECEIKEFQKWAESGKKQHTKLTDFLKKSTWNIQGKSTFKDEFVTAGGIALHQIDVGSFSSKIDNTLFFVGEVLDIDAITGGFNFQAAWTGAWHAARALTLMV